MSTQLEEAEQADGSTHRAATLTPQARRLVEGRCWQGSFGSPPPRWR